MSEVFKIRASDMRRLIAKGRYGSSVRAEARAGASIVS